MSQSALRNVASYHSLRLAWDQVLTNSNPRTRNARQSGESINEFSTRRDERLSSLRARMLSSSGYDFSSLRPVILPKSGGGNRIICVPSVEDRVVQRATLNYLTDGDKCGIKNTISYGFIQDRGVKKAVTKACSLRAKNPWAYKTDIQKFFDRIDRERLKSEVRRHIKQRSLHQLVIRVIDCEIEKQNGSKEKKIYSAGIRKGKGIRQGMPLSPLLANLVLKKFDRKVETTGYKMLRYADDLIAFEESEEKCKIIHNFIEVELAKVGHNVPPPGPNSKTVIYAPSGSAEYLGMGIVNNGTKYIPVITKEQKTKILQAMADSNTFEQLVISGITIGRLAQRLEATIAGYIAAYEPCKNLNDFINALDSNRSKIMTKIFEDGLGLSLSCLNDDQRAFLGLLVK
ncbi:MAG: reverse transcriptase/maturase family protein [Candidatus Thiodiazotropha endolucinida]|nr:reverse transcriptase/maturase family protein [Candidatus Thiodiazotropha endolucinida]